MKTKIKYIFFLFALTVFSLSSCESFLDMPETEEMTFEKIWEQRSTTEKYLTKIYSVIFDTSNPTGAIELGAADESTCSWSTSGYAYSKLNSGSWSASDPAGQRYERYYQGAREANIFMQNIASCSAADVSAEEKEDWYNEARFLRAFFYAELMKMYGPIILLKDIVIEPNAELADIAFPRNTWNECMTWVCDEFLDLSTKLPAEYTQENHYGKPTSVTALALIARMKLYSARELFNGNKYYSTLVNPDGTRLFDDYDESKWDEAVAAGKVAIDALEAAGHGIYVTEETGTDAVYHSLRDLYYERWNKEMIWSRYIGTGTIGNHTRPRAFSGGYGGWGPTQQQVDAYAMNNGIYPIIGYEGGTYFLNQSGANGVIGKPIGGTPTIDPASGYGEKAFSSYANPALAVNNAGAAVVGFNMYKDREPRFYAQVSWNNTKYYQAPNTIIQYHNGSNTGNQHHDHPWSGYMVRKHLSETINATTPDWGWFNWPLIRVAEVYLNYCEALVEAGGDNTEMLKYLNLIRIRAGVPAIGTGKTMVYGDERDDIYGSKLVDKNEMRELVRRERRVELSFEGHRYYDTRQWMIAETVDDGTFWGMNLQAINSDNVLVGNTFWQRSSIQTRVFRSNHYLYPFSQRELDRNDNLIQNYGW